MLTVIMADPDAIASAWPCAACCGRKVASVTTVRTNVIKRSDNLALIKLLKLQIPHLSEINPADFTKVVMVDSQPHHIEAVAKWKYHVIIDHHPLGENRPLSGYPAGLRRHLPIMTEYLVAAKD